MITRKSLMIQAALQQQRHAGRNTRGLLGKIGIPPSRAQGVSVNGRTRTISCWRVLDPSRSSRARLLRISLHQYSQRAINPRRPTTIATRTRRMSSNDAASSTTEPTSEETAQQLSQLLEQPLALESFITKELTTNQRQAIQHLVRNPEEVLHVNVPEPSRHSLRLVAMNTAIPFVGFGIMDNMIMILAGDMIDTSLGVTLGISTMCAAAIGNIVSDVAGVMLGTVVEDFCARYLNLPTPVLSTAQRQLTSVRFANQFGCAVGLVIGCIIGMFPLMFIDSNRIQARKREAAMDAIFRDVMEEASSLIGAKRTCLYVLCEKQPDKQNALRPTPDGKYLYAKYGGNSASQESSARVIPLGRGIVSRAALTGESWNIENTMSEPDFIKEETDAAGDDAKTMLYVPVLDGEGRTIAVIQAHGKVRVGAVKGAGSMLVKGFTTADVQILKALASHISVSLQHLYIAEEEEESRRLQDAIRIMKESGISKEGDDQKRITTRQLFPDG